MSLLGTHALNARDLEPILHRAPYKDYYVITMQYTPEYTRIFIVLNVRHTSSFIFVLHFMYKVLFLFLPVFVILYIVLWRIKQTKTNKIKLGLSLSASGTKCDLYKDNPGKRVCGGCGLKINDRFLLKAIDRYWHEDCLKCSCCECRLGEVGSTLYTKAELILCKRDYLR